eukprot:Nk52_evm25s294 gene=Nk52_evmTU25s294
MSSSRHSLRRRKSASSIPPSPSPPASASVSARHLHQRSGKSKKVPINASVAKIIPSGKDLIQLKDRKSANDHLERIDSSLFDHIEFMAEKYLQKSGQEFLYRRLDTSSLLAMGVLVEEYIKCELETFRKALNTKGGKKPKETTGVEKETETNGHGGTKRKKRKDIEEEQEEEGKEQRVEKMESKDRHKMVKNVRDSVKRKKREDREDEGEKRQEEGEEKHEVRKRKSKAKQGNQSKLKKDCKSKG